MTRQELIEELLETEKFTEAYLNSLSNFELFQAWMEYEGILGYSKSIWDTVKNLLEDEL